MGQRDGFSKSDLEKVNKMYKCSNVPSYQGPSPSNPTYSKPPKPSYNGGGSSSTGGGGYTNPIAQAIGGIGSIFQALG